ncbi:MAG TPA: ABC transporter transmembrane domain-containing protein, partial [Ktedonobacteraceae bacterium]|nr:ABC transporter transmembrane domain-containing protein [Ktedonobacteraceae bacterium]
MGFHGMGGGMSAYLEEQKQRGRKTDARTLGRIAAAFKPYMFQVILVLVTIIVTSVLGLVNPLLIQRIFDDAIAPHNTSKLILYVIIMLITPIISGLIGVYQTFLNNVIGQNVMRDFRNRLYEHLQSMSLRFFTATRTGEIQSRLSNDVGGVQAVVTNTATSTVANIATFLSTLIAMIILSPLLTLISLGLLPLFVWFTYKVGNVRRVTSKETQKSMASLTAMMQETLSVSGILLIKTFGRQKYAQQQFEDENQKLTNLEVRQQLIGRWFMMFISTFFSIMPAIVYLVAGTQIINHQSIFGVGMTFGTIVAFTTLQSRIFFPVGSLLQVQVDIQGALALFDRIFEYLDIPVDIKDKPDAIALKPEEIRGEIAFKHVSFTYKRDDIKLPSGFEKMRLDGNEKRPAAPEPAELPSMGNEPVGRPTLNDISFTIKPGQLAALVGPSGAGKTTITYLVPRLYEADSGAVEIDGHNVKDLTLSSLGQ